MGWPHLIDVPALGLSGGLIFAWRLGVDFELINASRHSISLTIRSDPIDRSKVLHLFIAPLIEFAKRISRIL